MTRAIRDAAQALYAACCGYGSMREQDIRDATKALGAALTAPEPTDDERVAGDAGMPVVARLRKIAAYYSDAYQCAALTTELELIAAELEAQPAGDAGMPPLPKPDDVINRVICGEDVDVPAWEEHSVRAYAQAAIAAAMQEDAK